MSSQDINALHHGASRNLSSNSQPHARMGRRSRQEIKASILSFLNSSTKSAHEVATNINLASKPAGNISEFRDEVGEICIYTSKYLPANHVSQDKLAEVVQAMRELPHKDGQPEFRYIFQDGCSMLIEVEGKKELLPNKGLLTKNLNNRRSRYLSST